MADQYLNWFWKIYLQPCFIRYQPDFEGPLSVALISESNNVNSTVYCWLTSKIKHTLKVWIWTVPNWNKHAWCSLREDEGEVILSSILLPNESSKKSKSTVSCRKKRERRDAQDEVRRISKLAPHSKGQDYQLNKWIWLPIHRMNVVCCVVWIPNGAMDWFLQDEGSLKLVLQRSSVWK